MVAVNVNLKEKKKTCAIFVLVKKSVLILFEWTFSYLFAHRSITNCCCCSLSNQSTNQLTEKQISHSQTIKSKAGKDDTFM